MAITEAYLFDAAWMFLALWTAVVLAVSLIAFRSDLGRAWEEKTWDETRDSKLT
jgi:hypothetical protein